MRAGDVLVVVAHLREHARGERARRTEAIARHRVVGQRRAMRIGRVRVGMRVGTCDRPGDRQLATRARSAAREGARRQRRVTLHRAVGRDEHHLVRGETRAARAATVTSADEQHHGDHADDAHEQPDGQPGDGRRDGARQLDGERREPGAGIGKQSKEGHHPPGQLIRRGVGFLPLAASSCPARMRPATPTCARSLPGEAGTWGVVGDEPVLAAHEIGHEVVDAGSPASKSAHG